jgi:hypothetical protein
VHACGSGAVRATDVQNESRRKSRHARGTKQRGPHVKHAGARSGR